MTQSLSAALAAFAPGLPLAVGLSGGADSTALLLACARRWPGQVLAVHVHHGLQAAADDFEAHCLARAPRPVRGFSLHPQRRMVAVRSQRHSTCTPCG